MKTIIELWMSSWLNFGTWKMQFFDGLTRNGQWMRVTTHIPFNKHSTLLLDSNKQSFVLIVFMLPFVVLLDLFACSWQWASSKFFLSSLRKRVLSCSDYFFLIGSGGTFTCSNSQGIDASMRFGTQCVIGYGKKRSRDNDLCMKPFLGCLLLSWTRCSHHCMPPLCHHCLFYMKYNEKKIGNCWHTLATPNKF